MLSRHLNQIHVVDLPPYARREADFVHVGADEQPEIFLPRMPGLQVAGHRRPPGGNRSRRILRELVDLHDLSTNQVLCRHITL